MKLSYMEKIEKIKSELDKIALEIYNDKRNITLYGAKQEVVEYLLSLYRGL